MLFGPKRKLRKQEQFTVTCNGHSIKGTNLVKYLGLYINSDLSGETIVNNIISKVNAKLKFLYRQSRLLDTKTKQLLCSALIQCHFDYSCSSWYEGLSKHLKRKLQITQNKVLRFVQNLTHRTSVTVCEFEKLNWLNVENRVKQLRLNHMYKIFYKKSPSYLRADFRCCADARFYNTRSSNFNFIVPQCNSVMKQTFYYNGIKDWNDLPEYIKSINNFVQYKKSVKKYLLESYKSLSEDIYVYN